MTEAEIEEHHLWVGKCINQWAQLEMQLFGIFSLALKTRDDFAAIIFYRDHAFRSKLKLTEEIVEARLSHDLAAKERWQKLCATISRKSEYRNKAAHLALWRTRTALFHVDGSMTFEDTGIVAAKTPDRLKRPREKDGSVDIKGLAASVRDAADLRRQLGEFVPLLKGKPPLRRAQLQARKRKRE
jgi:hypothetical protein